MRKQFVQVSTRTKAKAVCPWASVICKVEGGYLCFEDILEAAIWSAKNSFSLAYSTGPRPKRFK